MLIGLVFRGILSVSFSFVFEEKGAEGGSLRHYEAHVEARLGPE